MLREIKKIIGNIGIEGEIDIIIEWSDSLIEFIN
jgi:hypothetical protein